MNPKRLGDKRAKRTRTWAYVCASLFGRNRTNEPSNDDA